MHDSHEYTSNTAKIMVLYLIFVDPDGHLLNTYANIAVLDIK